MNATYDVEQAKTRWLSMARPIAYGLLAAEMAQTCYISRDRDHALAHCRMAIGHVASASLAALDVCDPLWKWCRIAVLEYTHLHVSMLESMLSEMMNNRHLREQPTRAQQRNLQRMLETQMVAIEAARAVVSDHLGGDPDLVTLPGTLYLELKANVAPLWHESEN
jgi:hypothetical protein